MPFIHLTQFIAAPVERVFDLSRSINLHRASMNKYGEKAIAGRTTGLIEEGETVTWQAKHLFKLRTLQVKLTLLKKPHLFIDEQVQGDFGRMKHEHHFKKVENGTIAIDQFWFQSPYGKIGQLVDAFYLHQYMKNLLEERNELIKKVAEGNQWQQYLTE